MGVLLEDSRQQQHDGDKHEKKHIWMKEHGVKVVRMKLDFGDYMRGTDDEVLDHSSNLSIDTKQHLGELSSNLGRQHDRFKREIKSANDAGYLLVVLVESGEVACLDDVKAWTNTHCQRCSHYHRKNCDPHDASAICLKHGTRPPLQGEVMAKQMRTMELTRSVRFEFCKPEDSARRICEILGVMYEDENRG